MPVMILPSAKPGFPVREIIIQNCGLRKYNFPIGKIFILNLRAQSHLRPNVGRREAGGQKIARDFINGAARDLLVDCGRDILTDAGWPD
ncbi:MAG: hypothetical protein PHP85_01175 [Gallionella sp.]|nr:hypothetical protein [Gallionella sp.]